MSYEGPLLSKSLAEFTPEEYKAYIVSLYHKREPRKATPKKKRLRDLKVSARRLKNGKISIKTKRVPKYLTEGEVLSIRELLAIPANELFIILRENEILTASHDEAEKIAQTIKEIPF
jgi:hypothetical protein